jgi:hypothetical protein
MFFFNQTTRVWKSVLQIRDVYTGPRIGIFPSRIQCLNDPGSGSASKYFLPKKLFLRSRKHDMGCSSRIRIRISLAPSWIQRVKKTTGSATHLEINIHCSLVASFTPSHLLCFNWRSAETSSFLLTFRAGQNLDRQAAASWNPPTWALPHSLSPIIWPLAASETAPSRATSASASLCGKPVFSYLATGSLRNSSIKAYISLCQPLR